MGAFQHQTPRALSNQTRALFNQTRGLSNETRALSNRCVSLRTRTRSRVGLDSVCCVSPCLCCLLFVGRAAVRQAVRRVVGGLEAPARRGGPTAPASSNLQGMRGGPLPPHVLRNAYERVFVYTQVYVYLQVGSPKAALFINRRFYKKACFSDLCLLISSSLLSPDR